MNNTTSKYTNTTKPVVGTEEWIEEVFSFHTPKDSQVGNYEAIRTGAKTFAKVILTNTISGADQTAAIRQLRESVMTANASIALDGLV